MSEKKRYSVRLMRWSDSSATGRTVTLKLPDDDNDHPFKGLPVGSKNGQDLEMEIWLPEKPPVARESDPDPATPSKGTARGSAVVGPLTRRIVRKNEPATPPPEPTSSEKANLKGSDIADTDANGPTPGVISEINHPQPQIDRRETDSSAEPPNHKPESRRMEEEMASYADRMGHAADALAAVADRMGPDEEAESEEHDEPDAELDDDPSQVGPRTVRRAVDLCRAVDNQRAGFFYFMRTKYPSVPKLPVDGDDWSRDSKATRDRVCFHCELNALDSLADDQEARKRFEALEHDFERTERFR